MNSLAVVLIRRNRFESQLPRLLSHDDAGLLGDALYSQSAGRNRDLVPSFLSNEDVICPLAAQGSIGPAKPGRSMSTISFATDIYA
jgi:hypothetical protein